MNRSLDHEQESPTGQTIHINLSVADVTESTAFYEAMGAVKKETFSDATASGMAISQTIHVMLLSQERWRDFTLKIIPDAKSSAQMLLCLSLSSHAAVDEAVAKATAAGGAADPTPTQDHGFMYGRSYEDPDGHIWEVMWMDAAKMEKKMIRDRD